MAANLPCHLKKCIPFNVKPLKILSKSSETTLIIHYYNAILLHFQTIWSIYFEAAFHFSLSLLTENVVHFEIKFTSFLLRTILLKNIFSVLQTKQSNSYYTYLGNPNL